MAMALMALMALALGILAWESDAKLEYCKYQSCGEIKTWMESLWTCQVTVKPMKPVKQEQNIK
jgi:hypothetical protein